MVDVVRYALTLLAFGGYSYCTQLTHFNELARAMRVVKKYARLCNNKDSIYCTFTFTFTVTAHSSLIWMQWGRRKNVQQTNSKEHRDGELSFPNYKNTPYWCHLSVMNRLHIMHCVTYIKSWKKKTSNFLSELHLKRNAWNKRHQRCW